MDLTVNLNSKNALEPLAVLGLGQSWAGFTWRSWVRPDPVSIDCRRLSKAADTKDLSVRGGQKNEVVDDSICNHPGCGVVVTCPVSGPRVDGKAKAAHARKAG